ncbi:MAG: hypothetical protein K6T86_11370 [Pirellulales bacterium]|nr:hypothetical protein [Pirellulales bacterium]
MRESIQEVSAALRTLGKPDPWSTEIKASDEFLDPLFQDFSKRLELPLALRKNEYGALVKFLSREDIDQEVSQVLDAIEDVAARATPAGR